MAPRRKEPVWLDRLVVDAVQFDLLRTHGGLTGLRDENALESALGRARHRWLYGKKVDLASLAAAYGFGLARSHPYRDGNKRIAFVAMATFLALNGRDLEATDADVVTLMVDLAAGRMTEASLARWIRQHLVARRRS